MTRPPDLPLESPYTLCYCEENIYLLCQNFMEDSNVMSIWNVYSIFISNRNKSVALWMQKNARMPSSAVVWDYHVVLLLAPRNAKMDGGSWIYDFDTTLPMPCLAQDYLEQAFMTDIDERYLRVVPGSVFIDNFASDRSHMLDGIDFLSPPPDYPPVTGQNAARKGVKTNLLTSFVSMEEMDETFGEVVELKVMKERVVTL